MWVQMLSLVHHRNVLLAVLLLGFMYHNQLHVRFVDEKNLEFEFGRYSVAKWTIIWTWSKTYRTKSVRDTIYSELYLFYPYVNTGSGTRYVHVGLHKCNILVPAWYNNNATTSKVKMLTQRYRHVTIFASFYQYIHVTYFLITMSACRWSITFYSSSFHWGLCGQASMQVIPTGEQSVQKSII